MAIPDNEFTTNQPDPLNKDSDKSRDLFTRSVPDEFKHFSNARAPLLHVTVNATHAEIYFLDAKSVQLCAHDLTDKSVPPECLNEPLRDIPISVSKVRAGVLKVYTVATLTCTIRSNGTLRGTLKLSRGNRYFSDSLSTFRILAIKLLLLEPLLKEVHLQEVETDDDGLSLIPSVTVVRLDTRPDPEGSFNTINGVFYNERHMSRALAEGAFGKGLFELPPFGD